jgi:hypothetical protein
MQRLARLVLAACLTISAFAGGFGRASAASFAYAPDSRWVYGYMQPDDLGFEIGGVWSRSDAVAGEFDSFIALSISRTFDLTAGFAVRPTVSLPSATIAGAPLTVPAANVANIRALTIASANVQPRYESGVSVPAFAETAQGALAADGDPFAARRAAQQFAQRHADDFGQLTFDGVAMSMVNAPRADAGNGVHFAIPVLHRSVELDVAARAANVTSSDTNAYSSAPSDVSGALAALPLDPLAAKLYAPNFTSQQTVYGAGVSLPVSKDVVVGVGYNTQDYHGAYGATTLGQNIGQRKDEYTATMTYTIPRTTSSFSALVGNQKYTDYVLPTFNVDQNREALNFTVRF